ncbi:hypothetical protein LWC34_49800 [Kibdelosporangium philippinense]|uniref:Uncharacterized protein n=1 Tax=Kibdelosporangium philippinense TaxID=211113 RepID=A0ABS8ZT40_9PSEU|nr:hypothetical protein [Kibdelosporangium philippinense]MCE7010847.1 hypothetical protein [Kibdelosporangium philippinense]
MTVKPADAIAAFDSASAMLEATARGITGRPFDRVGRGRLFAATLRTANLLPRSVRQSLYAFAGGAEGVRPDELGSVDLEAVAQWATEHYPERRYPAVLLGSSNGAAVHLATALGIPWLPQTMLIPVRWKGNSPDRPDRALEFGASVAPELLRNNPDIALHHMHDANQDRLMIGQMAYFRFKRRRLGAAYERFLQDRLEPGAPVIVLADESTWPVTTVADRHVFQVGAQGGIGPEDYDRHGIVPDTSAPEAEWGFDPALLEDVNRFSGSQPVHVIRYPNTHALSGPVADLYRNWLNSDRLLVESFLLIDPIRTIEARLVPLWTIFPVSSAVRTAVDYLRSSEEFRSVHIGLFPHGVESEGIAMPSRWRETISEAKFMGVDTHRYPADFAALVRHGAALRKMPRRPLPEKLDLDVALQSLGLLT